MFRRLCAIRFTLDLIENAVLLFYTCPWTVVKLDRSLPIGQILVGINVSSDDPFSESNNFSGIVSAHRNVDDFFEFEY